MGSVRAKSLTGKGLARDTLLGPLHNWLPTDSQLSVNELLIVNGNTPNDVFYGFYDIFHK